MFKDKLTDCWGGWLLQNHFKDTLGEVKSVKPRDRPPSHATCLSDTMHLSISFRKLTPPQNRHIDVWISNSEQQVGDFVGELSF